MIKLVLAILIAVFIRQSSCGCLVEQTHITLGDKYSLEQTDSDHALTIGFVTSGCESMPKVKLHVADGSDIDLDQFTSKSADYLIIDQSLPDKGTVPYLKTALFFKVTDGHLAKAASWSVYQGGQLKEGPVAFPTRFRSNLDSFRMFVVADMDINPNSASTIQKIHEIQDKDYDFLVHAGDFAYEIEDNGGRVGDEFFQEMSKTTKKVPYLITPGNHESYAEGSLLNYRFRMPNINDKNITTANHFYDFVFKGAYIMAVDFDYTVPKFKKPGDAFMDLFNWVKSRIEILNKRTDIQWKVFMSHRPFMCSDWTAKDCFHNMYWLRKFEDLLAKSGFQLLIQAHLHIYTRSKPMNGLEIYPQSKIGSGAMVSIIDGHSGTRHYFKKQSQEQEVWSKVVESVDASGPTYTMIEVNPRRFVSTLVRSDTGEYRDTFSIDRNMLEDSPQFTGRYAWFRFGMIAVLIGSILLTAFVTYKCVNREPKYDNETTVVESLGDYQRVEQPHPGKLIDGE